MRCEAFLTRAAASLALYALQAISQIAHGATLIACGSDQIRMYEVGGPEPTALTWSWSSREEHGLPASFQRQQLLEKIDDCKPVQGGHAILATSSTGGVVLIDRASGRALFWAHVAMAHSAELLPGGRVVVAASLALQGNRLELYDLDRPGQVLSTNPLPSGHGVIWDAQRLRLYALNSETVQSYALNDWGGAYPHLQPLAAWRLPGRADGHDLARLPGTGDLLVTTADGVWRLDPDAGRYAPYAPLAGVANVKAVSVEPRSGRVALQQVEESWWSHHIRLLGPAEAVPVPDMHLYKVRWLVDDGEPGPPPSLVAPGDCWGRAGDDGLVALLGRCARAGADIAALTVQPSSGDAGGLMACTPTASCAPLAELLATPALPRLLLRTPAAWLDDVQQAVLQARAGTRTLVEPLVDRPTGPAERTLAPGVSYRREQRSVPRAMVAHIVEVDLARTGTDFVVTTGRPDAGLEFVAEKTTAFARRLHTLVAVNATYFRPFEGGKMLAQAYVPAAGQAVEVDGVSIANGHLDSPWANPDPRSDGAFCVTPRGVSIVHGQCPAGTTQAVGAGPVMLMGGVPQALSGAPARELAAGTASITADELPAYYGRPQPRTALGLDAAGRRLWFVVVDGRQSGYSEGATLPELTALFTRLGASSAINLDGGGSSTLVLGTPDGGEQLANSPIHTGIPGRERPVGNHLGLRVPVPAAAPNPPP